MKNKKLVFSLLFLGLALWTIVPILGIFPLLLYIQLEILTRNDRRKNPESLNKLILILVILTVSVFCSSFTVHSDTAGYVNTYQNLDWNQLFNLPYGNGLEFVTFLLAYPIRYLSDGSPYWFLLNQSLIINTLVVFVISKQFSKQYYPFLLIIVFSSSWYYHQVFLMRQILSLTFLMAALASIESRIQFWIYCIFSFFSHLSSFPYLLLLIVAKLMRMRKMRKNSLESNKKMFFNFKKMSKWLKPGLLILLISILFGGAIFLNNLLELVTLSSSLLKVVGLSQGSDLIQDKLAAYQEDQSIPIGLNYYISYFVIFLGIILKKNKVLSIQSLLIIYLYVFQLILFLLLLINPAFNFRIVLLYLVFQGFFYVLAIEEKNKFLKSISWLFAVFSIVYFVRFLILIPSYPAESGTLVFFQGKPLSSNLYDYITFFLNARTNQ